MYKFISLFCKNLHFCSSAQQSLYEREASLNVTLSVSFSLMIKRSEVILDLFQFSFKTGNNNGKGSDHLEGPEGRGPDAERQGTSKH